MPLVPPDLNNPEQILADALFPDKFISNTPPETLDHHGLLKLRLADHGFQLCIWNEDIWLRQPHSCFKAFL